MQIVKVCLHNFRSHSFFEFSPISKGVTVLQGANGAGKSSIVDSIAWCLYDIYPVGVKKRKQLIRDGVKFSKDTRVGVVLTIRDDNGDILEIDRRIVSKAGACECSVYKIVNEDRVLLSGPAVSHSNLFLRKMFNLDEKSFLTSTFVQQKQVDNIITATPKERSLVFEKMTGVLALSESIKSLKDDSKTLKASLSLFNFDSVSHEDNVKRLVKTESDLKDLRANGRMLDSKVESVSKSLGYDKEKLQQVEQDYEKLLNARSVLDNVNVEDNENNLRALVDDIAKLKSKVGDSIGLDVDAVRVEFEELLSRSVKLENNKQLLLDKKQDLETFVEGLSGGYDLGVLQEKLLSVKVSIECCLQKLEDNKNSISVCNANISVEREKLSNLTGIDSVCSLCLQNVSESFISEQRKVVNNTISGLENSLEKLLEDEKNIIASLNCLQEQKGSIEHDIDMANNLTKYRKELEDVYNSIEKVSVDLEKTVSLKLVKEKSLSKANSVAADKALLLDKQSQVAKINSVINDKLDKINNAKQIINSTKIRQGDVEKLRNSIEEKNASLSDLKVALAQTYATFKSTSENVKILRKLVEQGEENKTKYSKLLDDYTHIQKAINDIEQFRQNVVDESVPSIESVATNLVVRFTNGSISRIVLDNKFSVKVESKGMVCPVEMLSGGEQSCVAIAIRLAITKLVANVGFVILDEVFVSMDNVRAENIVNTIVDLFDGQVVFISHTSNVGVIADKTILL